LKNKRGPLHKDIGSEIADRILNITPPPRGTGVMPSAVLSLHWGLQILPMLITAPRSRRTRGRAGQQYFHVCCNAWSSIQLSIPGVPTPNVSKVLKMVASRPPAGAGAISELMMRWRAQPLLLDPLTCSPYSYKH